MRRLISALAFFIAARSDDAISVALRLRPHDAGVLFESSCTAAAEIVVTGAPDGDHLLCLSIVGSSPRPAPSAAGADFGCEPLEAALRRPLLDVPLELEQQQLKSLLEVLKLSKPAGKEGKGK